MRIRVFPPMFINAKGLDEDGYIELEERTTVKKLMKTIKIPVALASVLLCSVNYKRAKVSQVLHHGDVVTFINVVSGG